MNYSPVPKPIARSPIVVLFLANLLGAVVGGLYFLAAARHLSLRDMGLYTAAISLQLIFASIVGGGLHVALVRLGAAHLRSGRRAEAAGLTLMSLLLCASLALLAAALARVTALLPPSWHLNLPTTVLLLATLWAGSRTVINCELGALLAEERYRRGAGLMLLNAGVGLAALSLTLATGPLTLTRLLTAHALGLTTTSLLGLFFLLPLWRAGVVLTRPLWRELLAYSRWPALCQGADSLQVHLAPFVVLAFASAAEAGLFGLGRYPAFVFALLLSSLYQYWLPAASRQVTHAQFSTFFRRQSRTAAVAGLLMVLSAVAAAPFLPLLGERFAAARLLFIVNALDFALLALTKPVDAVYHGLHRPQLELFRRLVRLPLIFALAYPMLLAYGVLGMAWAQVLSGGAALLVGLVLLDRELKALRDSEVLDSSDPDQALV